MDIRWIIRNSFQKNGKIEYGQYSCFYKIHFSPRIFNPLRPNQALLLILWGDYYFYPHLFCSKNHKIK